PDELLQAAVDVMVALNDRAAAAALAAGVRAMTDVTGFGLLGHLHNLCRESGLAGEVDCESVPAIPGVERLLRDEELAVSGGSVRNREWADGFARIDARIDPWRTRLLADATTSGGLLVAVSEQSAARIPGTAIGRLCDGPPGTIAVV